MRFFLKECFVSMFLILTFPLVSEITEQDKCKEQTHLPISKMQIITDTDRIEASKSAYDEEIKAFCLDNNCTEKEIVNALDH